MEKTICAIATPNGIGGISIIRISGRDCQKILDKIFVCKTKAQDFEPRKMYLGNIIGDEFTDKCLAVFFKSPESYTGEDVLEFHIHGGRALMVGILKTILNAGAVMAEAGEFTKRAFLNGKLSLSSCEGVIDMINAESQAEVKAGYSLLSGDLSNKVIEIQEKLKDILAEFFMYINHLDEDIDRTDFYNRLNDIKIQLQALYDSYGVGRMIKDGVAVSIIGQPNVGKSSILNKLLNFDRAIVTDYAGTTRDTLDVALTINGVKINLVDTAGIRDTKDVIEQKGIERSVNAIAESDIVLLVVDGSIPRDDYDETIIEKLNNKEVIEVINKTDKGIVIKPRFNSFIMCNALKGEGIDELKSMIYKVVCDKGFSDNKLMITNERHYNVLKRAIEQVSNAMDSINNFTDCVDIEIQECYEILGEITGTTANEDIIDRVFQKFCLGK